MQKADKERLIEELTERLRAADTLLVADYRGLTNSQLAGLRVELLKHGAKLTVVKNTLTRRAAEAAGCCFGSLFSLFLPETMAMTPTMAPTAMMPPRMSGVRLAFFGGRLGLDSAAAVVPKIWPLPLEESLSTDPLSD